MNELSNFKQAQIGSVPEDWVVCNLAEHIEIIGGGTPKTTAKEYWNGEIPWISVVDFVGDKRWIYETEKHITKKGLENSSTKLLRKGQIIISARGTVGELSQITRDMAFNQSCYGIDGKRELDNDFLYYLLKHKVKELQQKGHGAVFNTITKKTFNDILIAIPTLAEQRAIARILLDLDSKISLNDQNNKTLEAFGQAIFNRWFVDFEFPNVEGKPYKSSGGEMIHSEIGEIPRDWEVATIGKLAVSVVYGFTQSASSIPVGPKFLRITDIQGGKIDWAKVPYCEINQDHSKFSLRSGDIVVARTGASTGENVYIEECPKSVFASYLIRIRFADKNLARYVAKFMRSPRYHDYIASSIGGSAQPNANAVTLTNLEVTVPTDTILARFGKLIELLELAKYRNTNEIATLITIRNLLLPMLISGKIRVSLSKQNGEKL